VTASRGRQAGQKFKQLIAQERLMMVRLGDLDGTTTRLLLLVLVLAGAWTAMGWTTRILGIDAWTGSRALFRAMLGLMLVVVVAWSMTSWCAGVSAVVGAWTWTGWIVRAMRRLRRAVTHVPHRPRLIAGECACRRYDSWADHFVLHQPDCFVARSTRRRSDGHLGGCAPSISGTTSHVIDGDG
jgi:hypothetical protein